MSFSSTDLRFAHLSDPHFSTITWNPSQFFSKRWIGNWNLILFRKYQYNTQRLKGLSEILASMNLDFVCVTGDLTTTALDAEFQQALDWTSTFEDKGLKLYILPGNHDVYTKESEEARRFYTYFPSASLETGRVEKKMIKEGWWWVGLDCTIATPPFFSYGDFGGGQAKTLISTLGTIPRDQHIIVGNHFPLFLSGNHRHDLMNAEILQEILVSFPNIRLYLHGHDHHPYVVNRLKEGYPLIINSGSCCRLTDGGFSVIQVTPDQCQIKRFQAIQDEASTHWAELSVDVVQFLN